MLEYTGFLAGVLLHSKNLEDLIVERYFLENKWDL